MMYTDQELINRLKDLQDFADNLSYRMIEAEGKEYEQLELDLEIVEDEIEIIEEELG